jgi:N-methylhydantoinase B
VRTAADLIDFGLFRNAIFTIADEMAVTIFRTAYSGVLKSGMDYSTALADAAGIVVAQGLTQPSHLGSIPTALAAVVARAGDAIDPGDVFIMNDPYAGGMHLPDIFVFKPIFSAGRRIAFACTICHHSDVGGRVAGSNAADSTEIFQEGLRIPPLKLYRAGNIDPAIIALIEANVRMPRKLLGDLRAQLAACAIAEREVLKLVERFGIDRVLGFLDEVNRHAERVTRAAIATLPDGKARFVDHIDDDGIDRDSPIRLECAVEKRGDRFLIDWTGTSPQVRGALNSTLSFTLAATYTAVKSILPGDLPNCQGAFRSIEVIVPPGTVLNGVMPAACAARGLTGFRAVDACFGALAELYPDRVPAAGDGGNTGISIGGYHADGRPFVLVDFFCSAWGARPFADGLDGAANVFSNISAHSIEEMEAEHPVRICRLAYIPGSAGAGKFRGGSGVVREYELLASEATLQIRADRVSIAPYGLSGGLDGRRARNSLLRDDTLMALPGKITKDIHCGDVVRIETAGGGGWGDPASRSPEALKADERSGLAAAARQPAIAIAN